jgi:dTDP-4-amino-4,6-dideoxygalactose transaminase
LCLAAFDLGPGDEVLVPALTFAATVNAVLYTGASPVFVDIEAIDRPHMCIEDAERRRTPAARAVIIMNYGGYVLDFYSWRAFADKHGLKLIEDAAHSPAVGLTGQISDAAAFSFFSNKNMTTAEGGMVVAREPSAADRIRRMRSHGMTTGTLDRYKGHAYSYDVTALGYNYRMDELRAAVGKVQLKKVKEWNARRRRLSDLYRRLIKDMIPELKIPFDENHPTAAHLMPAILPERVHRQKVMTHLRNNGVQTSIHYPPVHRFTYYRKRFPDVHVPKTESFAGRELTLPLHPNLKEKDVRYVVDCLRHVIDSSEIQ